MLVPAQELEPQITAVVPPITLPSHCAHTACYHSISSAVHAISFLWIVMELLHDLCFLKMYLTGKTLLYQCCYSCATWQSFIDLCRALYRCFIIYDYECPHQISWQCGMCIKHIHVLKINKTFSQRCQRMLSC